MKSASAIFIYLALKPLCDYRKSWPYVAVKKMGDQRGYKGITMMQALQPLQLSLVLAVLKLCLSEGIGK